jgi:hypothetical protein
MQNETQQPQAIIGRRQQSPPNYGRRDWLALVRLVMVGGSMQVASYIVLGLSTLEHLRAAAGRGSRNQNLEEKRKKERKKLIAIVNVACPLWNGDDQWPALSVPKDDHSAAPHP